VEKLLFLGVGQVAQAVRARLPSIAATGTSRGLPDARFANIDHLGVEDEAAIRAAAKGAHVVVSFPPDGTTDVRLAQYMNNAAALAYVSSTGVYPQAAGKVDEGTAIEPEGPRQDAERIWEGAGASIVRLPAIYGPASGLHVRLASGAFRMPETSGFISRVHVEDAASFVIAALHAPRGSILLAGDEEPAPLRDVVAYVCNLFGYATPAPVPNATTAKTLQGDRKVNSAATRARYGITLRYPTYREGFTAIHATK